MGLAVLPHIDSIIKSRKVVVKYYDETLDFSKVSKLKIRETTTWNYSYYPIILKDENTLVKIQNKLNEQNIFPRRYFYPSLNTLNFLNYQQTNIAENISRAVLCLPLYHNIENNYVDSICEILNLIG